MVKSRVSEQAVIDGICVEITRKRIKNLHLRVHPPVGDVRLSAPEKMSMALVREFVLSRGDWIRHHQQRIRQQPAVAQPSWCEGERHPYLGCDYPLRLVVSAAPPQVSFATDHWVIQSRPNSSASQRAEQLEQWYRHQLLAILEPMSGHWQAEMKVAVSVIKVRKMKTRWGSCTPSSGAIRINLELVKKPRQCIEYVLVHELVHLLERGHNKRFYRLMDHYLPDWQASRTLLRGH